MAHKEGDIDLSVWVQSSDSPLNSDTSSGDSPRGGFGDLTIIANTNGDNNGDDDVDEYGDEDVRTMDRDPILEGFISNYGFRTDGGGEGGGGGASDDAAVSSSIDNELLQRLASRHDDFLSTVKSRYRFSCLTELDQSEQCAEPAIIRETSHCTCWPCDVIGDAWLKVKVYVARRCKLACCQEYAWPHEWARRRRFCISKSYYMRLSDVTTREQDAILRWADLVASQEWRDGNWSDRGVLLMSDASKFRTQRVAWSIMEEHLAVLAYSQKKELVFLAARISMEALAKNKAMYTHSQQYWGFARILTDLLRSPHDQVTEGLLLALQLYLRTLKIFHSCFSHKCTEFASAGLFPVLLDALEKRTPPVQAVAANILLLMAMHAPYITLISNMGAVNILLRLTTTDHPLLKARVFACLEIMAKHEPVSERLVQEGVLPLAVRGLDTCSPPGLQLSCLFILNSVCRERRTLTKALAIDNYSVSKSCMRILTDWTLHISGAMRSTRTQSLNVVHIQNWCTIPRQNLVLLCKLCVDELACRQLVKRGLVLKLRGVWFTWEMDRELVMEALTVLARWPRAGDKICQDGFLPIMSEAIQAKESVDQVLEIMLGLGSRHLSEMLEAGLLGHVIGSFGRREIGRRLHPTVMSLLALVSSSDRVRRLLLADDGRAYTLVLEVAVSASDFPLLQTCITVLSKMSSRVVPEALLMSNCVLLVAYIDKLLKTGPDGLVLHGLMQLQDYLRVEFLAQAFNEHHCQRVVEILAAVPYKAPVRYMASQVLQMLTGERTRRASMKDADTWQLADPDSDEELETAAPPVGQGILASRAQQQTIELETGDNPVTSGATQDVQHRDLVAVAERMVTTAFADATKAEPEAEMGAGYMDTNKPVECGSDVRGKDNRGVHIREGETEEEDENDSEIDEDAEVQVNIIGATDEDDSYEDNEDDSNNTNRNEESDGGDDEDFEIITVNDQDYVNI